MTRTAKAATLEREPPAIREALRTIPGLIAMIAVATIAVIADQGFESGATPPAIANVAVSAPAPAEAATPPSTSLVLDKQRPPVLVFYLVRTQAQAYEADWAESEAQYGGPGPARTYRILFAGTEAEERLAIQTVFEHMLLHGPSRTVQVSDLRWLDR